MNIGTGYVGKFFKENKASILLSLGIVVATAVVIGIIHFSGGSGNAGGTLFIPQEFTEARLRAGSTAENIVQLTSTTTENLRKISELDRQGNYAEGVALVNEELKRTGEIRGAASDLSEDLLDMARTLTDVSPASARESGFEAVSVGVQMVEHLIAYTEATNNLLLAIKARLESNGGTEQLSQIELLTGKVNTEVSEVNRLNESYRALMARFDQLTAQ